MAGFSNQGFSSPKGLHQSSSSNSLKVSSSLATSKTVMYKRRRASRRVPTTILETSCQEFRDAVQKLTGFHRPTPSAAAALPKPQPLKPRAMAMPSYEQVDHDEDDAVAAHPSSSSPQSALSDPEQLPHGEFFHHFLRESSGSPRSSNSKPVVDAASAPTAASRAPFAALANMRAAAYRQQQQQQGPFGHGVPPFWENAFGSDAFMGSLAKLQDPAMAPNPYLIALENQLLAKFARRMQLAATSNPMDNPWYQMDHMPPLRA